MCLKQTIRVRGAVKTCAQCSKLLMLACTLERKGAKAHQCWCGAIACCSAQCMWHAAQVNALSLFDCHALGVSGSNGCGTSACASSSSQQIWGCHQFWVGAFTTSWNVCCWSSLHKKRCALSFHLPQMPWMQHSSAWKLLWSFKQECSRSEWFLHLFSLCWKAAIQTGHQSTANHSKWKWREQPRREQQQKEEKIWQRGPEWAAWKFCLPWTSVHWEDQSQAGSHGLHLQRSDGLRRQWSRFRLRWWGKRWGWCSRQWILWEALCFAGSFAREQCGNLSTRECCLLHPAEMLPQRKMCPHRQAHPGWPDWSVQNAAWGCSTAIHCKCAWERAGCLRNLWSDRQQQWLDQCLATSICSCLCLRCFGHFRIWFRHLESEFRLQIWTVPVVWSERGTLKTVHPGRDHHGKMSANSGSRSWLPVVTVKNWVQIPAWVIHVSGSTVRKQVQILAQVVQASGSAVRKWVRILAGAAGNGSCMTEKAIRKQRSVIDMFWTQRTWLKASKISESWKISHVLKNDWKKSESLNFDWISTEKWLKNG